MGVTGDCVAPAVAFDPGAMALALAPLMVEAGLDPPARVEAVTMVDAKPGHRALLRYDLETAGSGATVTLYGKAYAQPPAATRVHDTMRALWDGVFSGEVEVGVPRPIGCLPELAMVVYVPATGDGLDRLLRDGTGAFAVEGAALWLSRLHCAPLRFDRTFTLTTELLNLSAWGALVAALVPEVSELATELALALRAQSAEAELDTGTPIHKDFHPGHVIVNGSVAVVDFDEVRLGDPAFDVAHFCTYLHLLAVRAGLPDGTRPALESAFLDTYTKRTGWERDWRFAFFSGYTAMKIAKQLCTARGLRPRPGGGEAARQLAAVLSQGLRFARAGA